MRLVLALLGTLIALPVQAQQVRECDWHASAWNLAEPWEENTRTFANGAVRLALLDTIEPAAAPFHLLLLSPPHDELGARQCRIVSFQGDLGFGDIGFASLSASYDPAIGLIFEVPATIYLPEENFANPSLLRITLNQASGAVGTQVYPGAE